MTPKDQARTRLLQALPHLRFAMNEARAKGTPQVGILALEPDGGGHITARFNAPDFFDDLALVLDAPPQSKEDDTKAAAAKLIQAVHSGIIPD